VNKLLAVALIAAGCAGGDDFRPLTVGDRAPAYTAVTLTGDTVSVRDFQGHVLLVNIWATWCTPCQQEMPGLQRLADRFADSGLSVVGVSIDAPGSEGGVRRFAEEHGLRFPIARDPGQRVTRAFRTIGVPETFLFDRQGRLVKRWIGEFDPTGEVALRAVRYAKAP
jgi:cytochrome c-type biogenesis protein